MKSLELNPMYDAPSSWWQHVPIAHFLIEAIKPKKVVELGTHYGVSFFSFCEAAEKYSMETFVYAIDTWEGDLQAGYYKDEVYEKVKKYRDKYHKQRSELIRSKFNDALDYFADKSIDLLHIDGFHTYTAVSEDYNSWKVKLKSDGTILFHDINVRKEDFGVWKLWEEIKNDSEFTCIELMNGYGLGIATKGCTSPKWHEVLKENMTAFISKGSLLEILAENRSRIIEADNRISNMGKHIENLELMNKDKEEQLIRAGEALEQIRAIKDYRRKKIKEVLSQLNRLKKAIRGIWKGLKQGIGIDI